MNHGMSFSRADILGRSQLWITSTSYIQKI